MSKIPTPLALFDTLDNIHETAAPNWQHYPAHCQLDYQHSIAFLTSYDGSQATFNAYRREVERLLHWTWQVAGKSVCALKRADIESYLEFCQKPPVNWIGIKKTARFITQQGLRKPNKEWRPFLAALSKIATRSGQTPEIKNYMMSEAAFKEVFAVLSSFYNFLIQSEATEVNPIGHIRQKSKYLRKKQGKAKIRRLSELQWSYVIETANHMAIDIPAKHERTLFIVSALYLMYLRISELAASDRWTPMMNDFRRDHEDNWWFTVIGKGNKEREIAVSNTMLSVLKRWRKHLSLPPLPSLADTSCLIPKVKGLGPITSTSFIRKTVQACFDQAIDRLQQDDFNDEAASLQAATVHWLRHTGISDDVKLRPREHVRDDAGHSSGATTDKYIDIERNARHASAKNKTLKST